MRKDLRTVGRSWNTWGKKHAGFISHQKILCSFLWTTTGGIMDSLGIKAKPGTEHANLEEKIQLWVFVIEFHTCSGQHFTTVCRSLEPRHWPLGRSEMVVFTPFHYQVFIVSILRGATRMTKQKLFFFFNRSWRNIRVDLYVGSGYQLCNRTAWVVIFFFNHRKIKA